VVTGIPSLPDGAPRAHAAVPLRFEDVTQDGRLVLEALPTALVATIWRALLADVEAVRALRVQGIAPILARLRMEGGKGPFSAHGAVEAEGAYRYARADDGRFMLEMASTLHAPIGRTYGGGVGAGERAVAGRLFAEHVLTRLFAPDGQRRVRGLDFPGAPAVTESRDALPPFESIATLPPGATPLEPAMHPDPAALVFGVLHTDSNRHVNSLAYLRVFEEAALRRFFALGRGASVLARSVDIAYRKPCFAGQAVRITQQAYEAAGRLGVAATLAVEPHEAADGRKVAHARPHAYVRMEFEE
jgi:hypothetical protein